MTFNIITVYHFDWWLGGVEMLTDFRTSENPADGYSLPVVKTPRGGCTKTARAAQEGFG